MRIRLRCLRGFLLTAVIAGSAAARQAADDPAEIFKRARQIVAQQLIHTLNYSCVQKVERSFYAIKRDPKWGCPSAKEGLPPEIAVSNGGIRFMSDRLRLDVAVSQGQEIYSWHGEAKFSTTRVADIVQTGPSSSGNFFGFLANIFVKSGASLTYTGQSEFHGVQAFTFSFAMPRQSSGYKVETRRGATVIPYHGMFAVSTLTYELVRLEIRGDLIPSDSDICSADTDIDYQRVNIAGNMAVIPQKFELRIEGTQHIFTSSQSEYAECHEFRGESTLRFDSGSGVSQAAVRSVNDQPLPAGLKFHVALKNAIDDRDSYTGDAVDAVLLDGLKVNGLNATIPKGATLHGIIDKLELRYTPHPHYLASVLFDRLTARNATYILKARPITSSSNIRKMGSIYGWPLTDFAIETINRGVVVSTSEHIHLEKRLPSEWITLNVHQAPGSL